MNEGQTNVAGEYKSGGNWPRNIRSKTTSHQVTRLFSGNAEHPPDALKMHSQSCCEVHLDSAESKRTDVRPGRERALV